MDGSRKAKRMDGSRKAKGRLYFVIKVCLALATKQPARVIIELKYSVIFIIVNMLRAFKYSMFKLNAFLCNFGC